MSTTARQAVVGVLGIAVAILTWQLAATTGPLARSPLPTATDTITTAASLMGPAALWSATGITVIMAFGGLLAAAVVGIGLGAAIGVSPVAMHATRVVLEFLKPIPPIVILPIVVLVLGPTLEMGIFLTFFGCVFAIAMQTSAGIFDSDPVAIATARSYGLGPAEILRRVVLPSATPYIGTSLRVCAPTALIVAVVAGLLGGGPGLGQALLLAQLSGDQAALFAYVLILGVLGLIVQGLSVWAERRALHWHPQYRKVEH